ncbi:MAG: hypothetical protein U5K29_14310 [Acidimicrobiales bacterium]|nr:hypothetical protein [Acidimicrobiales bacterium]
MTGDPTPPSHPLVGRQRRLIAMLRLGLVLGALLALAGMLTPGRAGERLAYGFVALIVAVPVLRVGWLTLRWFRRHDLRFALVGLAVLGVVTFAGATAW